MNRKIKCGKCNEITIAKELGCGLFECESCGSNNVIDLNRDYTLREWLGFNYGDFIISILDIINVDEFENLLASSNTEIKAGKLTSIQVDKLKEILKRGFTDGQSIRQISKSIDNKLELKDLLKIKNNKLVKREGEYVVQMKKKYRSAMIARTETIRLSNLGAVKTYEDKGIEQIRWVASTGDRTCDECISLNGKIFNINEAEIPPLHPMCRCTTIPIVRL